MRDTISRITHGLSWVAVVLAIVATVVWFGIVGNGDAWGSLSFMFTVLPVVSGSSLLGTIPGAILYSQTRQRRDLMSLWMSAGSRLVVVGEAVLLFII